MGKEILDQPLSEEVKADIKQKLTIMLQVHAEAKKKQMDTPENLRDAENLLTGAENCIGGMFTSSIKGAKVKELEDKVEKVKTSSKFSTLMKKWARQFVELCKSPNSYSKQKDLQKTTEETALLVRGKKIIVVGAKPLSSDARQATDELRKVVSQNQVNLVNKELHEKFANKGEQAEAEKTNKTSDLKRSQPVKKSRKIVDKNVGSSNFYL